MRNQRKLTATAIANSNMLVTKTALESLSHRKCVESPNDRELGDRRSGRGGCMVRERRRLEAAAMKAERVRCSACFGLLVSA
jgi:hypothetical protein